MPDAALDPEVSPELRRDFWTQVLVFNVALLAASLGALLIGFRGQWRLGGGLLAVGAASFLHGYHHYRTVRDRRNG
jgi:hypothetical protein